MSRWASLLGLFFLMSGCSAESPVLDDAAIDSTPLVEDAATTETEDSATTDAATPDAADSGPCGKREQPCCGGATCESGLACQSIPTLGPTCLCDTSVCDRFGYVCSGNKSIGCGPTAPGSCYVPQTTRVCPTDQPCDPATGTCGGCNASDPCSAKADGTFLGCSPYTAEWCRKGEGGCVKTVKESCGIACVGGARQGCCGGEGQMCCSPPGAACASGLSCNSAVCSK